MGDRPLESPSLVWDITRLRPALDIDTDPIDRSGQQSTPTLSLMSHRHCQGQSAELAVGEKCLVKGTYPHITPFVSRRPLTCPRQPPFRRSLRPARPVPIRCTNSCPTESVGRCEAAGSGGVDDRPDMMSTHRSTTPLPQATVGSGGNHPQLAARRPPPAARRLQVPGPLRLLLGPLPETGSDSDVPNLWPVIRRGNANNPICYTPGASLQQDRCDESPRGLPRRDFSATQPTRLPKPAKSTVTPTAGRDY
jgi:hypothetical protein